MTDDDIPVARSTSDLEALRAAVTRIEGGESTGLFDDLRVDPAPAPQSPAISPRARRAAAKEAVLQEVMDRIEAAHPEGIFKPIAASGMPDDAPPSTDPRQDRDADPYAVARAIVLRQLTTSPKSRQQLRGKLRQRNCPDEVAEAVLDRMSEVGLVDDEKYAEAYVRSKQVSRGLSTRALAHELRTKGVDRDTAEAVLAEVSPMDEEERARRLVDARLPRLRELERNVVIRRLAGMLARKGYSAGMSLQVIREAVDADPAFGRD